MSYQITPVNFLEDVSSEKLFLLSLGEAQAGGITEIAIEKAGYIPANHAERILFESESFLYQKNNAIIVLGDHHWNHEYEQNEVFVFPMTGSDTVNIKHEQRIGRYISDEGKWEKHALFLVKKKPKTRFGGFFKKIREKLKLEFFGSK
jgi:hypothetical protein